MITLGLVDSVDDNGVYVTMPGSKGVLRGPYKSLSTVAAGTTVLVASTDDGEQVVVGPLPGDGPVDVMWFGAKGDGATDDTVAMQAALDAAAGGTLRIPRGRTFVIDKVDVPSDILVTGGGTLKFKANTTAFALLLVSAATDVTIEGITFDGNVANQTTWVEGRHALQIYGSSRVTVRGCKFTNLIGDGIYLLRYDGASPTDVDIVGNTFAGDNTNRNGVSVISGISVRIRGNHFEGMSRDDMPGAVDLEPNTSSDAIEDVSIFGNTFIGGGTPDLQKAVAVNNNAGASVTGVSITDNRIRGVFKYGIAVFGDDADKPLTQAVIAGNTIAMPVSLANSAAIIASALCEVDIVGNVVDSTADIGIKSVGSTFTITGNKVKNANLHGIELLGGAAESGIVADNLIEDCGNDGATSYGGIHVKASGVHIVGNRVANVSTTNTRTGLYVESGTKNLITDNTFSGMAVRALNCSTAPQVFGRNIGDTSFNSIAGTYPPAAESWVVGDVIHDMNPTAGGYIGWVCTTAGTPGTWKTFGAVTP